MKRILVTSITFISIALISISCGGGKAKENSSDSKEGSVATEYTNVELSEKHFGDNWNQLESSQTMLTKEEYDALNLGALSFIPEFGELQYEIGSTLIDEPTRKLLTVKTIASGEISEYLLGYINNNVTDSLLISYEDNVEYFSEISSVLNGNKITVTTIDFDYSGEAEIADTIRTSYIISKELTFDEILQKIK